MGHLHKKRLMKAFKNWREGSLKDFYNLKLQNAAAMVEKMSKFSRSFISLNSLSQIIIKNKQRVQAKAFHKWSKQLVPDPSEGVQSGTIQELERKLA